MVVSGKFGWKLKGTWLLGRWSSGKVSVHVATEHPSCIPIYLGKPVGPWFWQMISKIQDWWILSRNHGYHLYKSVPFTQKRPQMPETGIKGGLEDSIQKKQDYPFRCYVTLGNFPPKRPAKSCVPYIFQPDFLEMFCKMVNSLYVLFSNINWLVILVFWKWVTINIKLPCWSQLLQIYSFWHIVLKSRHRCFNFIYKVIRMWWLFWVIDCLQKKRKKTDQLPETKN